MFTTILRIILIWWLVMVIYRWVSHMISSRTRTDGISGNNMKKDPYSDNQHAGDIEDADFEEIEGQ